MRLRWIAAVVAGVLVLGGRVAAQVPIPGVEVGGAVGGIFTQAIDLEGEHLSSRSAEVRVTVPFAPHFAIEGGLLLAPGGQNCCYKQFEGFYTALIRQRLTRERGRGPGLFLTYGGAGYLARERYPTISYRLPNGDVMTRPARSAMNATPPFFSVVGVGLDEPITSRVSLRMDVQSISALWLPLGVRASAGVSIGFGRR